MLSSNYIDLIRIFGLYILWIVAHYLSAHLYANYCTKPTVMGFISSPFLTMSPQCQAIRWVIYNGAYTINVMWLLLAKWIINNIQYTLPNILLANHNKPPTTINKDL